MIGRAYGKRKQLEVNTFGEGQGQKREQNKWGAGQDGENIVSLTQHDYYGSRLQNQTYIAYIELLAFSEGWVGREEGKEVGTQSISNEY